MSSGPRWRWQAPPGWPPPPLGWSPPPGWAPDPSWPPPPPGWVWWRPTDAAPPFGRTRWALIGVAIPLGCLPGAIVVLLVGFFVALMVAQGNDDAAGCGSIDPTDPGNYSTVAILNDTRNPVIIDDCQGAYCRPDQDRIRLSPGKRVQVDAACAASGADMTSWRVTEPSGLRGYVAVDTPRKHDGLVYPVSRATSDRAVAEKPLGAP